LLTPGASPGLQGVCGEKKWPYRPARFAQRPAAPCYLEALTHQVTSYQLPTTISPTRTWRTTCGLFVESSGC